MLSNNLKYLSVKKIFVIKIILKIFLILIKKVLYYLAYFDFYIFILKCNYLLFIF